MSAEIEEGADDYMSDVLLEKCGDIRPGIVSSKSLAKRYKLENMQQENNIRQKRQKLHVVEREVREEALAKPISSDNKGFAMLARMGYKPGMSLGKVPNDVSTKADDSSTCCELSASSSARLKEPISIDLKNDRKGLGHKVVAKEKQAILEGLRKALHIKRRSLQRDYETKRRETILNKTVRKNLYDSQKACFELDSRSNITEPENDWYWPDCAKTGDNVDEDAEEEDESDEIDFEDDLNDFDKLAVLTNYLRTTYFYCLWCGTTYDNSDDLLNNCPGDSKEAHDSDDCDLSNE